MADLTIPGWLAALIPVTYAFGLSTMGYWVRSLGKKVEALVIGEAERRGAETVKSQLHALEQASLTDRLTKVEVKTDSMQTHLDKGLGTVHNRIDDLVKALGPANVEVRRTREGEPT